MIPVKCARCGFVLMQRYDTHLLHKVSIYCDDCQKRIHKDTIKRNKS